MVVGWKGGVAYGVRLEREASSGEFVFGGELTQKGLERPGVCLEFAEFQRIRPNTRAIREWKDSGHTISVLSNKISHSDGFFLSISINH